MQGRLQRTIRQSVETSGIGFLTGGDIRICFHPAEVNQGIEFRRTDCPGSQPIPARIEFAVHRQRRTAIERDGTAVEMIEHVTAALAGLWIDNCVVEIDGPEPPGFDGSSLRFAELLLSAGIVEQPAMRPTIVVPETVFVGEPRDESEITYRPPGGPGLTIAYHLDYGPRSPIRSQKYSLEVTPESFLKELAFARTFLLETEATALRAAGYGARTSTRDLLVFAAEGPIGNELRAADECARHKLLDCLGDFALLGCDVHGQFSAYRSGHHLNRSMVRKLTARAYERDAERSGRAA
ncbi:MAG TPA: UDP-3-O-acyl-N-acetylglucosamine deacetylase [Planctomycetaceae bacterium]|jgi:UDP-3-O-acyl N-acetylglucosamine deacetylase|nr:UDP-3-O-acyl-N-acetylglucosamine deacetylase [Planctomycetaceae bacterium]